jgi:hypothetical protein
VLKSSIMRYKKPTPIIADPSKACPFCGQRSYSLAGIHPQCAASQADAQRQERRKSVKKEKAKKPTGRLWEKKCPKCSAQIPARRRACDCGHEFFP